MSRMLLSRFVKLFTVKILGDQNNLSFLNAMNLGAHSVKRKKRITLSSVLSRSSDEENHIDFNIDSSFASGRVMILGMLDNLLFQVFYLVL